MLWLMPTNKRSTAATASTSATARLTTSGSASPTHNGSQEELFPSETALTTVFTDGSCLGNPGRGGWAWIVPGGRFASGAEPNTTNQRMEVQAVLEALRALEGPVLVASDSAYVVNCFQQKWWAGWQRRNWKNASGHPVANQDLWEPLLALALDPDRKVRFKKVQGHSGDPMNDLVDRLAVEAATLGAGRSGTGSPE
jgi:ribonuclease HI